jgi:hypothetical protein
LEAEIELMMVGRARQKLELERLVDEDAVQGTTV